MNPLSPSILNAERARAEAAQGATGRNSDAVAGSGGFADMLRDLQEGPAKAMPPAPVAESPAASGSVEAGRKAPESPSHETSTTDRANDAATAVDDAVDERRAAQAGDDRRRLQQRAASAGRGARSTAGAEASGDGAKAPGRTDGSGTDTAAAGASPTLAHWLLAPTSQTVVGGEAALPPPQTGTADDEPDAAALTHDLIQGLRVGAARGGVGGARDAVAPGDAGAARVVKGDKDNQVGAFALPASLQPVDDARLPPAAAGIQPGHAPKAAAWQAAGQDAVAAEAPGLRRGDPGRAVEGLSAAGSPVAAGSLGVALPAGLAVAESAPVQRTVDTPVGAPGFEDAVMASVATLVRDGVHEARLQLNPAELGPLAVRISVADGAAHIDIAAAHGATRDLLQAGLPALADALRADGLTLASSQVSDGAWVGGGTATGGFDLSGGGAGQRGGSSASETYRGSAVWTGAAPTPGGDSASPDWLVGPGRANGRGGLDLYA